MPKFFINNEQIENKKIYLQGEDVKHIKNVLRKTIGDELIICNNSTSKDYLCNIIKIQDEKIECEIIQNLDSNVESNIRVTIIQALPKSDKMELIIQKSVELGVYNIIPVEMKRCIVKIEEKNKQKKILRWQKISEVASKQSGRNIIPKIENINSIKNICNFSDKYDIVIVAYENEKDKTLKQELKKIKNLDKYIKDEIINIAVIIGPEGGIDDSEIELLEHNGAKIVSLGKRILRTETVALNVLSVIIYELEK